MLPQAPLAHKVCPRCKRVLELRFFQEPVRICMICYGGIPGNELISTDLDLLKEKAQSSKFAKAARKHFDSERRLEAIAANFKAQPRITSLNQPLEPCAACGELTTEYEPFDKIGLGKYEDIELLCPKCYSGRGRRLDALDAALKGLGK